MANGGAPKITPGETVIMASGLVSLIFSFLPWYSFDPAGPGSTHISGWGDGLFPVSTLVPLFAVIMAVQVALDRVAKVKLAARIGEFTWEQLHFVLAVGALIIAFCYMFVSRGVFSLAPGYWMDLIASVGLVAGAVMIRKERKTTSYGGGF